MKIGDIVTVVPETFDPESLMTTAERRERERNGDYKHFLATGKVTYIHPTGRYYTVEFDGRKGKIHESFTPDNTVEAFLERKEYNRRQKWGKK